MKIVLKGFLIVFIIVLVDILTKVLFQFKNFTLIPKVLFIKYSENPGVIFGLFKNNLFVVYLLPILIAIYIGYLVYKKEINLVGGGLIIAGLMGNLINRLIYGYVIDFIFIPFYPKYNISLFNLADLSLIIGIIISIYYLIKKSN